MLRIDRIGGRDGGGSGCNAIPPKLLEGDFLFFPLIFGLPTLHGDALFGASFSLEQASAIVMPAALDGAISSLHALHEEQRLFFRGVVSAVAPLALPRSREGG